MTRQLFQSIRMLLEMNGIHTGVGVAELVRVDMVGADFLGR